MDESPIQEYHRLVNGKTHTSACRIISKLQTELEKHRGALERIDSWIKAYPLKMFPEPDFKKVAEVLKAAGLSLDEVSASNMRHVITKLKDITEQALKEKDEQDTLD